MSFSVAGKTAIVTGAANGVGLAISRHLLDAGANVHVLYPESEKASVNQFIENQEDLTIMIFT